MWKAIQISMYVASVRTVNKYSRGHSSKVKNKLIVICVVRTIVMNVNSPTKIILVQSGKIGIIIFPKISQTNLVLKSVPNAHREFKRTKGANIFNANAALIYAGIAWNHSAHQNSVMTIQPKNVEVYFLMLNTDKISDFIQFMTYLFILHLT